MISNKFHAPLLLAAIALFAGCGPYHEQKIDPRSHDDKERAMMTGWSFDQVVNEKYDSLTMTCRLWSQRTMQLDTSLKPNSQFTLDLKQPVLTVPPLTAKIPGHTTQLNLAIKDRAIIQSLTRTNADQTVDKLQETPMVILIPNFDIRTYFEAGPLLASSSGDAGQSFYERQTNFALSFHVDADGEKVKNSVSTLGHFYDYAECRIDSILKDAYRDDYQPNVQP